MFRRIVVVLGDGSYADQLGAAAISLAAGADAEVVFVQVGECSACCGPPDHPALREHERDLLSVLLEKLSARGIRARGEQRVTVTRRVSRHILDAVEQSSGDLLIIAAGQSGRFRSLSHRRLIARLLREAPCPVYVVPVAPETRKRMA